MKLIIPILIFFFFSFNVYSDQTDHRLKNLFRILAKSNSNIEINRTITNIWNIWHETNDPIIESDFFQGIELMKRGKFQIAIKFFTRVIENNPNFAEGWNKRATAYYMLGDFNASMLDINQTLKLEPRHFGAMDGMGLIFIHFKEFDKAIIIYDRMLEIFPNNFSTIEKRKRIKKLLSNSV